MLFRKLSMIQSVQFFCIAFLATSLSCYCYQERTSDLMIAIEQRYYMIMRLKKPIATLIEASQKRSVLYPGEKNTQLFKNPLIHKALVAMERTQSSAPFYKLWSYFLAYKFIEDKEFIREMLTVILLLYKDLIISLGKDVPHHKYLIQSIDTRICMMHDTTNDLSGDLTLCDDVTKACQQYKTALCPTADCQELNAILSSHHSIQPLSSPLPDSLEEQIGTIHNLLDQERMDTIAFDNRMRFYYIQRLLKSMFILSRQKEVTPFVFDDTISNRLTCPSLQVCIKELIDHKSLAPLFRVWAHITAYDFIHDTQHVREFALITCLVYKQMVSAITSTKAVAPKDILLMYEKLATLPVAELLDLLDDVVEQYDTLAHNYALKDSSLTWKQWFKKYWWSAPIVIGSFINTLLKHAQLAPFFQNNKSFFQKEVNSGSMFLQE